MLLSDRIASGRSGPVAAIDQRLGDAGGLARRFAIGKLAPPAAAVSLGKKRPVRCLGGPTIEAFDQVIRIGLQRVRIPQPPASAPAAFPSRPWRVRG